MGRVLTPLQGINDERVEVTQCLKSIGGNGADIGAICNVLPIADAHAKSKHLHRPMRKGDRRPGHRVNLERAVDLARFEVGSKQFAFGIWLAPGILEDLPQDAVRLGRRPYIQRPALQGVEPADIVQPHDMVGVGMGEDNRINAINAVIDGLQPQFGGCIDEHPRRAMRDDDAAARAPVAGIGAGADFAMAADHRHAGAGAGAEKEQFEALKISRHARAW